MVDYDKLRRPGSGVDPRPLDHVEREIVRADMAKLIAREKESGDWAKWEESHRSWRALDNYYVNVTLAVVESRFSITAEIFQRRTGRAPVNDDLDRCNCPQAGTLGHQFCGWCAPCNLPRFMCITVH
jgi:hypothetical protein